MTIGEVAKRCGLRASAIRYYEGIGLLPRPPRLGGRRMYGDAILDRIAFIQFARSAGFRMTEIRALAGSGREAPLSKAMRRMAERKLGEIDQLIARADLMKQVLAKALRCQCIDPRECGRKIRAAQCREVRDD